MSIPSKQIGWSQESNLLWEISKQMEKLTGVASASGGSLPYKVYTALLTQTYQDPPVATILQNTLGFTPTWEYVSVGQYRLVSPTSGGFPTNKTFITISQVTSNLAQSGDGLTDLHALIETTSRILLYDKNAADDSEMYDTPIEIRVYP